MVDRPEPWQVRKSGADAPGAEPRARRGTGSRSVVPTDVGRAESNARRATGAASLPVAPTEDFGPTPSADPRDPRLQALAERAARLAAGATSAAARNTEDYGPTDDPGMTEDLGPVPRAEPVAPPSHAPVAPPSHAPVVPTMRPAPIPDVRPAPGDGWVVRTRADAFPPPPTSGSAWPEEPPEPREAWEDRGSGRRVGAVLFVLALIALLVFLATR